MLRIVNLILVVAMVVGAVVTYNLKHETEKAAYRVSRLHAGVAKEREAIALLKTEWSMLSQPGRLQALVARYQDHFRLEPFAATQVATLDEIAKRPVAAPAAGADPIAAVAVANPTPR